MTSPTSPHLAPEQEPEPDPTTMHRGCGTLGLAGVALLLAVAGVQTYRFAQFPRRSPPRAMVVAATLVERAAEAHLRRSEAIPERDLPPRVEDYATVFPGLAFRPSLPQPWPGDYTLIEACFLPALQGGALQFRWGREGERPVSLFLLPPSSELSELAPMTMTRAGLRVQLTPTPSQIEILVDIP